MRRRDFLGWLGRSIAVGTTWAAAWDRLAASDLNCWDTPPGPYTPPTRVCVSGLPSEMVHVTAVQEASQWCWAACISMVFGYHGHPVSQQRIVSEAYGGIVNMPAQPWTMLAVMNRPWLDDLGYAFTSLSSPGTTSAVSAAQDLAANLPLIVGTLGHAVVLTALEYGAYYLPTPLGPQLGPVNVTNAIVRDPWPGVGKRFLTPQEWYSISFAVQIRVQ
jgi:hypothetical protein